MTRPHASLGIISAIVAAGLAGGAIVAFVLVPQGHESVVPPRDPSQSRAPDGLILPFNLPCALKSDDSPRVFSALRARDKSLLMTMLAQRKYVMVRQGSRVKVSNNGSTAAVSFSGPGGGARCFVSTDIVPLLQREAVR
jgi:hypothetical protein